ncbi:MAG: acyl-CoA-binding protein [Flavobacteriales bacterium]|nr:acyl-CoA-binding protein [Flavobacteriales bacterium]|tara:strand:- start:1517 stop:1768 length:252 start_codon:yes stop_codon:yes gene_type:complete
MNLHEQFEQSVTESKQLPEKPSNDVLLKIYSLYKQATQGDVSGEKPNGFDFVNLAKYNAWESQKGKTSEESMQEYIDLINSLK